MMLVMDAVAVKMWMTFYLKLNWTWSVLMKQPTAALPHRSSKSFTDVRIKSFHLVFFIRSQSVRHAEYLSLIHI